MRALIFNGPQHLEQRRTSLEMIAERPFDVAIIGGGINGACVYNHCCRHGYRCLLLDRSDFGAGTSQASAMMIWGGLLYLRNGEFRTVRHLCRQRDDLLTRLPAWTTTQTFRYILDEPTWRRSAAVRAGLMLYWLLGNARRRRPRCHSRFHEQSFLKSQSRDMSFTYEEATLHPSDARFVLRWILPNSKHGQIPMNYCGVRSGRFESSTHLWDLELEDTLARREIRVRARCVVNAAGVWTDAINRQFDIQTPYKHVFSKGVFIGLPRDPCHRDTLLFDMRQQRDVLCLVPWGPVSLWGPTETALTDLNVGFHADADDVRFLLDEINRHLSRPVGSADIVSMRAGVRPLAVDRSFHSDCYPLDLSRRHYVCRDSHRPWINLFGGKLTGCDRIALEALRAIASIVAPPDNPTPSQETDRTPEMEFHPTLAEPVPTPDYCVQNEYCRTLDDYLRRRTNIAQWVPRGGLGRDNEHVPELMRIARCIRPDNDPVAAVQQYRDRVHREFDDILSRC